MSIIMQLVTIVFPKLKKIQEEEGGKKKINRWTRYGTVLVALIQSYTVTVYANSIPDAIMIGRVPFALLAMLTITTGTMFLRMSRCTRLRLTSQPRAFSSAVIRRLP